MGLRAALRRAGTQYVRVYHRLQVEVRAEPATGPVLVVANHGFGGIVDLNLLAIAAALDDWGLDRPVVALVHQLAWTLRAGPLVEAFGGRPAGPGTAERAFAEGSHVLVLPGGDLDAMSPWTRRNEVDFHGRHGFATLAREAGVPVLPVVTAGAGDTLLALSDGRGTARALRLDRFARVKALPVTVSLPWGFTVGVAGLLPYLPLPARMTSTVLPAVTPDPDEDDDAFARRVEAAMHAELQRIVARRPAWG
ncbi:hypothetical protein GCM10027047_29910 [Rhodococcus aerolatus]